MLLFMVIAPMKVRRRLYMRMPAGLLTQFQQLGDSLMEATERQTQPTPHESLNKHTLAVMKYGPRRLVPSHSKHQCFTPGLGCRSNFADMSCDGQLLLWQQFNHRVRHMLCCACAVQSKGTSIRKMMPQDPQPRCLWTLRLLE